MFLCNEKVWPLAKQLEVLSFGSHWTSQLLIEKVRKKERSSVTRPPKELLFITMVT